MPKFGMKQLRSAMTEAKSLKDKAIMSRINNLEKDRQAAVTNYKRAKKLSKQFLQSTNQSHCRD